jgi:hypothetical protein
MIMLRKPAEGGTAGNVILNATRGNLDVTTQSDIKKELRRGMKPSGVIVAEDRLTPACYALWVISTLRSILQHGISAVWRGVS